MEIGLEWKSLLAGGGGIGIRGPRSGYIGIQPGRLLKTRVCWIAVAIVVRVGGGFLFCFA